MTLEQMQAQFKKWDVPYRVIGDPKTHRRDPAHGTWGPVYGCGTHHTGDDAPDTADRKVISEGRSDLAGPLAQLGLNDDGVLDIHSIGRANHFGGGDPDVLRAVINESYGDYPPHTNEHQGSAGSVDGNPHFYGMEVYYSGGKPMSEKAYNTMIRVWAAICDFHQWSAKSVIGHNEWSDWKIDPGHEDMKLIRRDVQQLLDQGPTIVKPKPKPKPTPNITAAIKAGIAYEKALLKISDPEGKKLATSAIQRLKADRKALREQERK
jgi:hypothetical protein